MKTLERKSEKGAAMVIVLMIASILLVATAGILLKTSMHSSNVTDISAEQKAYNSAESGIQTALNVLRGNVTPNPLIDDTKPATHPDNKISFSKAVRPTTSNQPTDTSTVPRFSRWMNYDYTPSGSVNAERVSLGEGTYTPLTGNAYDIEIIDPDNPTKIISLEITGDIDGAGSSKTFGLLGNTATLKYNSSTQAGVDVSIREASIDLGNFTITTTGVGATVPNDIRFEIKVKMTAPFNATKIIRGTIKSGFIGPNNIHNVKIDFDSNIHILMGSIITIPNPITPNPPSTNGGKTDINVTVTLSEPNRLLIRSTGYGPRGAKKILEAMVQKDLFNGGLIPSTLAMIGDTTNFKLETGLFNHVIFSGRDISNGAVIPPIAANSSANLTSILGNVLCPRCRTTLVGNPADVSEELPDWLSTTLKLDTTIENLKVASEHSGRYYKKGQSPPNFGNNADGTGITFIDDDVVFSGTGGGILVTTGKLVLKNSFDFNGIIIVTGEEGVQRRGFGFGTINGNVVVSPYDRSDVNAGFLSPKFDMAGGFPSTIILNANVTLNNLTAGSVSVLGVVEK